VGRGGNLLLNVPPNRKGLIDPLDSASLMEFKHIRDQAFANDVFKTAKILRTKNSIEAHLSQEMELNMIVIKEDISKGQRIVKFEVSGGNDLKQFHKITEGTTIGHKRILTFPKQRLKYIRINVTESKAIPILSSVAGYFKRD
jgi:alpha-L-fucosidase